ncbi:MAG: outer membrane protein assembly factor BamD [Bacteroidota bacterium]
MKEIRLFFLFLLVVGVGSCSRFRRIQKSGDWKAKYEAALQYYQDRDYHRAEILLDEIRPIMRGTAEAELGEFYLAYCYYYQKQYILSAHHFEEFVRVYGRSEYMMEASYRYAHSLYLQSPDYQLDQTVTYQSIAAMQNFINRYPSSDYAAEADRIIDRMQQKLEKKAYEQCKLYFRLRRYKSALTVYDNFKDDYPDSKYQEEVAFLKIQTSFDYAKESISSKQEERFQTTIDAYLELIDKYPNSEYLKEAEKIYAESIEEITRFANSK